MATSKSKQIGDKDLLLESGTFAKLADGAAVVRYGDTMVLATCVSSTPPRGDRFLPAHDRRRGADVRPGEDPRQLLPA